MLGVQHQLEPPVGGKVGILLVSVLRKAPSHDLDILGLGLFGDHVDQGRPPGLELAPVRTQEVFLALVIANNPGSPELGNTGIFEPCSGGFLAFLLDGRDKFVEVLKILGRISWKVLDMFCNGSGGLVMEAFTSQELVAIS